MRQDRQLQKIVLAGWLLGALTGCQMPAAPPADEPARLEQARGGVVLTVRVPASRRVQAIVEQVVRVGIAIKAADGAEFEQVLPVASGQVSTTLSGLAPGGLKVTLRAYDASDRLLSERQGEVMVVPGVTTTLTLGLQLHQTLPSAPPMPSSVGFLPTLGATVQQVALTAPLWRPQLAADPTGGVWFAGDSLIKLGPDGSELVRISGSSYVEFTVDSAGRVWASDLGGWENTLRQYAPDGTLTVQIANVGGTPVVEADDHVLVAGEGSISRVSAAGEVVDFYEINASSHAVAPSSGNLWVVDNRAMLRQYTPDGVLLSKTLIPIDPRFSNRWEPAYPGYDGRRFFGDELAIDASGSAWLIGIDEAKISKVGPDGTLLGEYLVCADPSAVTVDLDGNIWVGSGGTGESNLVKLAPDGTLLGTLTVSPRIAVLVTDVDGHVWVGHRDQSHLTKVTP